jgi:hypothetical protein
MTDPQKKLLFRVAYGGAGLLYVWALFVFWMAPEWQLSDRTYYRMAVLPALVGVVALCTALGLYVDLQKK